MKKFLEVIVLGLLLTTSISHSKSKQELHNDGVKALQERGK